MWWPDTACRPPLWDPSLSLGMTPALNDKVSCSAVRCAFVRDHVNAAVILVVPDGSAALHRCRFVHLLRHPEYGVGQVRVQRKELERRQTRIELEKSVFAEQKIVKLTLCFAFHA